MKKSDLQDLARLGVRQRLADIERHLAEIHAEFPDEFLSPTPPVLLRPALRASGGGWPALAITPTNGNGHNGNGNGHNGHHDEAEAEPAPPAGKRKAKRKSQAAEPKGAWGQFVWQRVHDYLATQEGHKARAKDIMASLQINTAPTLYSAVKIHPDVFIKPKDGVIRLKKVLGLD